MENELVYYEALNRTAIKIIPQKPFYDWVRYLYPDHEDRDYNQDNNNYLVREMDSNEEAVRWLRKNFKFIFANELHDWNTDDENWPSNRNWKLFKDWFKFEISSMIMDTLDDAIAKE